MWATPSSVEFRHICHIISPFALALWFLVNTVIFFKMRKKSVGTQTKLERILLQNCSCGNSATFTMWRGCESDICFWTRSNGFKLPRPVQSQHPHPNSHPQIPGTSSSWSSADEVTLQAMKVSCISTGCDQNQFDRNKINMVLEKVDEPGRPSTTWANTWDHDWFLRGSYMPHSNTCIYIYVNIYRELPKPWKTKVMNYNLLFLGFVMENQVFDKLLSSLVFKTFSFFIPSVVQPNLAVFFGCLFG